MSLRDRILGRPLRSDENEQQQLSVLTGVPVLGLDALASTGYGPEAALTMLLPLGLAGERFFPYITLAVVVQLLSLYVSYRQTQAAYPGGGGAYLVAKDNLGVRAGLIAAVALLLDYFLNVAVAIAAGVGAVVSAIPALHAYTLPMCLGVLGILMLVNLRGVRESGQAFSLPVFLFIALMTTVLAVGLLRSLHGSPQPVVAPPPLPAPKMEPGAWILLGAFANGLTAMTGVEAVSNGVPLFRAPTVPRAHRTLTAITVILALFLLGIAHLCPAYHIGAMDQGQPGYQTIWSQLVAAVFGRGVFYYVALASIFVVLTFSAQTSFTDFPRVCRFLADDRFLPKAYARRGRRLVFSNGIVVLTLLSGTILLAFGGVTDRLIPLFAVGAFTAFLLSQVGMVIHWWRQPGRHWLSLASNGLGALTTATALVIIVIAKFLAGAWMVLIIGPGLIFLLSRVRRHYLRVGREIETPLTMEAMPSQQPIAIVPIEGWNKPAEKALRLAVLLSREVVALHVSTEQTDTGRFRRLWAEKVEAVAGSQNLPSPRLEIISSPFRRIHEPIIDFIRRTERDNPQRLIAIVLLELAQPRWYEALLHNVQNVGLKTQIDLESGERTFVIYVPWHLH